MPGTGVTGARESVDRGQDLAPVAVGVGDTLGHFLGIEIQPGIIAGIGAIAEAAIDRIGAGIDGRAQRRRRAGGTNQFKTHGAPVAAVSAVRICLTSILARRVFRAFPPARSASHSAPRSRAGASASWSLACSVAT